MSYTKTTWRNNQSPAINADNLNHIEQGIYDAHNGLASANNNMELMDDRLQAEIDDVNSDISTLESNLAAETSARTQQDSVLSARMDTFTQLPSGSTSGDAELIDIRVGANGTTYPTAGDAVRGQVSDLKSAISEIEPIVIGEANYIKRKKIVAGGGSIGSVVSDSNFCTTVKIPVSLLPNSQTITVYYGTISEASIFCLYNSDDTLKDSWTLTTGTTSRSFTFTNQGAEYVRFSFQKEYDAKITDRYGTTIYWQSAVSNGVDERIDNIQVLLVNEVSDVKSELNSFCDVSQAENLYNSTTATDGAFVATNGVESSSSSYCHSAKISVKSDETYSFWALTDGSVVSASVRFLCAYNSLGSAVSADGGTYLTSYTVPTGITDIIVSFEQKMKQLFMVVEGSTQPSMLLPYSLEHYTAKGEFVTDAVQTLLRGKEYLRDDNASATANTEYSLIDHLDNKKNCAYSFFGKFSSFTSLEIGHGKTEAGANYIVIDDTNITSYQPDGTEYAHYAHGLTITDFISVSIKVSDAKAARAVVNIVTKGGSASISNVIFFGCNGKIYYKCGQTTTDVTFIYNIMDLRKDIYVFGDSYISLADDKRWPEYAITNNDNNMLLCGFAGASAEDEYPSFQNIVAMAKPKYLCWFLGMNNPDGSSAIDSRWVTATSNVIGYCEQNGIVPILATIPNTPSVRNTFKNAWVKNSGRRYVDFARAVGAESAGSSWYSGMLSSDNVHPTAEGAKALWLRLREDLPEIME